MLLHKLFAKRDKISQMSAATQKEQCSKLIEFQQVENALMCMNNLKGTESYY